MPVPTCPAGVRALTAQEVPASCIYTEHNCTAQYKGAELGSGKLYIAETDIVWMRDGDECGFKLYYKQLIAHAISKDLSTYPRPCVYMLYESGGEPQNTDSSEDDEEGEEGNIEIRIAPQNDNTIQRMYEAISDGQLLHPDQEDSDSEEDQGFNPGGLATSTQIRFDSDGQLLVNPDNEQEMDDEEESRRFEDMEED